MKGFGKFIHFVNWVCATVAALLAGAWGCQQLMGVIRSEEPFQFKSLDPLVASAVVGGFLLLFFNILFLVLRVRFSKSITYLVFEKEGSGSLKVSIDAIENMLTQCATGMPEVRHAKVKLKLEKGGKMPKYAIANCVFNDVPNLFAVQDNTRQSMSDRYQDVFPGEDLQIEIIVDHLQPEQTEPEPKKKKKKYQDAQGEGDFPGPRYPID